MQQTIHFYGHLGEAIGHEIAFDAQDARSVGELRDALARRWPDHADELRSGQVKAVIADKFVSDDEDLAETTHIEFLPPVSGG